METCWTAPSEPGIGIRSQHFVHHSVPFSILFLNDGWYIAMTLLLDAEHAISQHRVYDDVYNALTNLVPRIYVELWL